jgi:hypothetical protein
MRYAEELISASAISLELLRTFSFLGRTELHDIVHNPIRAECPDDTDRANKCILTVFEIIRDNLHFITLGLKDDDEEISLISEQEKFRIRLDCIVYIAIQDIRTRMSIEELNASLSEYIRERAFRVLH